MVLQAKHYIPTLKMEANKLIEKLYQNRWLEKKEMLTLLSMHDDDKVRSQLAHYARIVQHEYYDNKVYIRGLIEISNICKNDCYYCGIRASNHKVERYALNKAEIMECVKEGYELGFRTFVMQSGENLLYDDTICEIIREIHQQYPDCAITLSFGEKTREQYQAMYDAGASRYLLRQESANEDHYRVLHPSQLTLENRLQCQKNLREIGFQTGCGIMVGSPYQTLEHIYQDLKYMKEFQPHMVGIGPFLPHCDTPFKNHVKGSFTLTLMLLSIIRLILPGVLLPSTTALSTIHPKGRELGILAGGNVIMPNLSPLSQRKKYMLYNDKACMDDEAAQAIEKLKKQMQEIGYQIVIEKGDSKIK